MLPTRNTRPTFAFLGVAAASAKACAGIGLSRVVTTWGGGDVIQNQRKKRHLKLNTKVKVSGMREG
jgi:hypothetical protein